MKYDALLKRLLVLVPGCSDSLAQQALADTAQDFCTYTHVLTGDLDPFYTQSGTVDYDLAANEPGVEIVMLNELHVNGQPIEATSREVLRELEYSLRQIEGFPICYEHTSPESIRLYPVPDAEYEVQGSAVLRPVADAPTLPDRLAGPWRDALLAGAASWLCAVPDQPFSRPEAVGLHAARYMQEKNRALIAKNTGFARTPLRANFRAARFV